MRTFARCMTVALAGGLLLAAPVAAQSAPRTGGWIELGPAVTTERVGAILALAGTRREHLLMLRLAMAVDEFLEGGDAELLDVGLLYGRHVTLSPRVRADVAAGPALVACEGCEDGTSSTGPGLAVSAALTAWPARPVGVGLHVYGNVNTLKAFAGAALTLRVGWLP